MPTATELGQMGRDLMVIEHPLVYLACPYTHGDPAVREARFDAANKAAAALMRQGLNVFSPITSLPSDCASLRSTDRVGVLG